MRTAVAIAVCAWATACGADDDSIDNAATAVYEASSEGRLEVARVNGVPVYGDCVENQAEAHGLTAEQALEQCIDFELLAQAARDAGYLSHPSVVRTSRRESVRALIDHEYPFTRPENIPDKEIKQFWNTRGLKQRYNHGEGRSAHMCLVRAQNVSPKTDAKARKLAAEIYDKMLRAEGEEGPTLMGRVCVEVRDAQPKSSGPLSVTYLTHRGERSGFMKEFADPLWKLEKVNDFSGPHRAPPGWFVIMMDARVEASSVPFDVAKVEIAEGLFSSKEALWWRMSKFDEWYESLARSHSIESYPERIPEGLL